jgi:hypothetical protein
MPSRPALLHTPSMSPVSVGVVERPVRSRKRSRRGASYSPKARETKKARSLDEPKEAALRPPTEKFFELPDLCGGVTSQVEVVEDFDDAEWYSHLNTMLSYVAVLSSSLMRSLHALATLSTAQSKRLCDSHHAVLPGTAVPRPSSTRPSNLRRPSYHPRLSQNLRFHPSNPPSTHRHTEVTSVILPRLPCISS